MAQGKGRCAQSCNRAGACVFRMSVISRVGTYSVRIDLLHACTALVSLQAHCCRHSIGRPVLRWSAAEIGVLWGGQMSISLCVAVMQLYKQPDRQQVRMGLAGHGCGSVGLARGATVLT